jgi:hypothetical protein
MSRSARRPADALPLARARLRVVLMPSRFKCLRCGSPDAEWLEDDLIGRMLVCLRCQAVTPAALVRHLLESEAEPSFDDKPRPSNADLASCRPTTQ